MPLTVPVLRLLEACRGERIDGPLVLRPVSGKPKSGAREGPPLVLHQPLPEHDHPRLPPQELEYLTPTSNAGRATAGRENRDRVAVRVELTGVIGNV